MVFFQDTQPLSDEVIDSWSAQAEEAYKKVAGKRAVSTVKFRLTLEELLLRFRDCYGNEGPCLIRGSKSFNGIRFEIAQQGERHNPVAIAPDNVMTHDMLARLNLCPQYAFHENRSLNIVTIPVPVKPVKNALLIGVLAGVLLAVFTWMISSIMPGEAVENYLGPLISGLFTKLSTIFSALATPLVFFAVIAGIVGIGDITSFGKLGIVVYMPNGAILLGSTVWVLTYMSLGGVSPLTLVRLVFVAVIVAIAAPPIPGSAVAVLPILFSATGTDLLMMPVAVIIASTIGYLLPAANGYCLQLEILMSAWKSGVVKK